MLDNQLIAIIVSILRDNFSSPTFLSQNITTEGGINITTESGDPLITDSYLPLEGPVNVKQAYQPKKQGINTGPTIYLHKIGNRRYGWLKREPYLQTGTDIMGYKETQYLETMFQIGALVTQNPANINQATASDLANVAASIMQSSSTLKYLQERDVGIYRVTDVRNPYFSDDRVRNEASPSFDFTLTHKQVIITTLPSASPIEGQDYPI